MTERLFLITLLVVVMTNGTASDLAVTTPSPLPLALSLTQTDSHLTELGTSRVGQLRRYI